MIYGSVCSGIEAASVAWEPLGFKPAFFSEIEKFPRAVLAHHWPDVPLHGDFTTIGSDDYGSVDILVGGTPCQSFSVAGLRGGLKDERGNLALEFIKLAIRKRPRWIVWENVPGVLSSNKGRDFGAFIGALVECGYGCAWRVLDAQFFGVPQRRRRVFVVAYLGDWQRAGKVLFEREGMPGDFKEGGETEKRTTSNLKKRTAKCRPHFFDMTAFGQYGDGSTASTCKARDYKDATDLVVTPMNTQVITRGGMLGRATGFGLGKPGDPQFTISAAHCHAIHKGNTVRRLTPIECERLQGFPDNHTRIPWTNKPAEKCPDGPRYKAIGNSMAVPVMRWIGERIKQVENLT